MIVTIKTELIETLISVGFAREKISGRPKLANAPKTHAVVTLLEEKIEERNSVENSEVEAGRINDEILIGARRLDFLVGIVSENEATTSELVEQFLIQCPREIQHQTKTVSINPLAIEYVNSSNLKVGACEAWIQIRATGKLYQNTTRRGGMIRRSRVETNTEERNHHG